jgi:hypothetical protein
VSPSRTPQAIQRAVIPAQPGWAVVVLELDGTGKSTDRLYRSPVIAWLIEIYERETTGESFADTVAITATGSLDDCDYALQLEDRPRFFTVHADYDTEADLLSYFRERNRLGGRSA